MKKLMIAAAVAAMIGGVQADEIGGDVFYDFVAYLTTTAGQPGEDAYTSTYRQFGVSAADQMWYNDSAFSGITRDNGTPGTKGYAGRSWRNGGAQQYPHLNWTLGSSLNGVPYPKLEIAVDAETGLTLVNANEVALLEYLGDTYKYDSYGYYCGELTWWQKTEAQCYRVAGSDTITAVLGLESGDCCDRSDRYSLAFWGPDGWDNRAIDFGFTEFNRPVETVIPGHMEGRGRDQHWVPETVVTNYPFGGFLNRFGAQKSDDAMQIETFAKVSALRTDWGKKEFNGYLAGQGWADVKWLEGDEINRRVVAQIEGNIVGYTEAPECPDCCVRPLPKAIAFECVWGTTPDGTLPTAAYGSFYLMYRGQN